MNAPHAEAHKAKAPSLAEITGAAAFALGLISAWLYLAGWTYAYHYFDRFGIPLLMVDIPKENYFVYGGIVVQQFPIWELVIGIVGIAAILLWHWLRLDAGRFKLILGVVAVLAAFWVGHQAAVAAAHQQYTRQRESDYSAFPRVQVWPKDSATSSNGPPRASTDLTTGCYRLLLHNQDRLFLLRPFKGAPAAELPVLISPWDQIEFVRVLPDYTSCE
jgi:hypothetical protein